MSWLLRFIPTTWLWPAAGIGALVLVTWGSAEHWRANHNAGETRECKDAATLDRANQTKVALDAATKYRAHEAELATKVKEAQHDYTELQASHARTIVAERAALAESGRLRGEIAAYAAGGGGTAGDTCTPERERAIALGQLLAEALRADAESSNDAEANADAVRTILKAWPQ